MATVLVVDDEPNMRIMLIEALTLEDYPVLTAVNGAEALEHMGTSRQRLVVLLNLIMPVFDGAQVLQAIADDPALAARHRIIMMTGSLLATQGYVADLRQQLDVPLIAKPFTVDEVLDAVEKAARSLDTR